MNKKNVPYIVGGLAILMMILFMDCAIQPRKTSYIKDDKEYGKVQGAFRHRWWNYYERGLSFAEGEFFQEAVADLKKAIQQRTQDQRMVRTYGMHFIDYFPHRELGIIYYEIGMLEEAETELELSLSLFPSSKAYFYLDQVRKRSIEREGKEVAPPTLRLSLKADEFWTREDPVVISGVAEDENYVAGITIRGQPIFLEGSQKLIPFEKSLDIPQGRYSIEVAAKNLLGKITAHQVVIYVDREGPIITLDELDFEQSATGWEVRLSGFIYDAAGVSDLYITNQPIAIEKGKEAFFSTALTIDTDTLDLMTQDQLGNKTTASILLTRHSVTEIPWMFACADPDHAVRLIAGLFDTRDTRPPIIRFKDWTDTQTVFLEKVYIEGEVSDESRIESLTINQIPILRHEGRHIFFSHFTSLKEGENNLTIWARDEAGNSASKTISIIRRVPKALQLAERLSLTTFPFEQSGTVSEASFVFQDRLIDALVNQNRFRVIERGMLDMILQEQRLSRTKVIDKRTALMVGRLAAAQSVITGAIIESRTGIEVVARMIDTETSEILATEDVYGETKDMPALRSLAEGMAIKFHRAFPLINGLVIECKENDIFTDLGQDMIKLQRRLIVYREESVKHPLTGRELGADTRIIGHARITQVMPQMSKAELLELKAEAIKRFDNVITQ